MQQQDGYENYVRRTLFIVNSTHKSRPADAATAEQLRLNFTTRTISLQKWRLNVPYQYTFFPLQMIAII